MTAFTRDEFTRTGMSLGETAALFARHRNARVLSGSTAAAAIAPLALGKWTRRDAAAAAVIVGIEPIAEWLIHVHVLHGRPRSA